MTYKVEIVEGLPQPTEPKWLDLRTKLDDMLLLLKPLKITLEDSRDIDNARSTVHAWSRANNLKGRVHTTLGEEYATLYVYMT